MHHKATCFWIILIPSFLKRGGNEVLYIYMTLSRTKTCDLTVLKEKVCLSTQVPYLMQTSHLNMKFASLNPRNIRFSAIFNQNNWKCKFDVQTLAVCLVASIACSTTRARACDKNGAVFWRRGETLYFTTNYIFFSRYCDIIILIKSKSIIENTYD